MSAAQFLRTVIIYFVDTERPEQDFYRSALPGHDLRFVAQLDEVEADAEAVSVFIQSRIDGTFLDLHPNVRLVTTRSTATDHIDRSTCVSRGVTVSYVPHYGETTVAEHTFALILALSRRLREVMLKPKNERFSYEDTRGFDLAGRTLGIIGMGRIGRRVVSLAHAFGMTVVAHDVDAPADVAESLDFEFVALETLLARAHIISLHATISPATYHILNRDTLARCRRGVLIVNTARGALIDTGALRDALENGQVGGAGLDVLQDERVMRQSASQIIAGDIIRHLRSDAAAHDARDADRIHELQELMLGDAVLARSNVVFTPHVAFNSEEAVARLRQTTAANIVAFVNGEPVNVAG